MTRFRQRVFVCGIALVLAGCGMRLPFGTSGASTSGPYFTTKLCGVALDGRNKVARLHLTLEVVRALPRGGVVETEFRDSVEKTVHTVTRAVNGSERSLELVSPPIAEVRVRSYETTTRVYASGDRKAVLGSHAHVCQSLLDRRDLGAQFH